MDGELSQLQQVDLGRKIADEVLVQPRGQLALVPIGLAEALLNLEGQLVPQLALVQAGQLRHVCSYGGPLLRLQLLQEVHWAGHGCRSGRGPADAGVRPPVRSGNPWCAL